MFNFPWYVYYLLIQNRLFLFSSALEGKFANLYLCLHEILTRQTVMLTQVKCRVKVMPSGLSNKTNNYKEGKIRIQDTVVRLDDQTWK